MVSTGIPISGLHIYISKGSTGRGIQVSDLLIYIYIGFLPVYKYLVYIFIYLRVLPGIQVSDLLIYIYMVSTGIPVSGLGFYGYTSVWSTF